MSNKEPTPPSKERQERLLDAWFNYRDEADKFLFAAGAAGVGFCLSRLFSDTVMPMEVWALFLSAMAFGISCGSVIMVFHRNSDLMAAAMGNSDIDTTNGIEAIRIGRWDNCARITFVAAVLLLLLAAATHLPLLL